MKRLVEQPAPAPTAPLFDELRRTEFARLDAGRHVYLDYTGAGPYSESHIEEHLKLLRDHVFGNPHSDNPTRGPGPREDTVIVPPTGRITVDPIADNHAVLARTGAAALLCQYESAQEQRTDFAGSCSRARRAGQTRDSTALLS